MWLKKQKIEQSNEQLERVVEILSNCNHLVKVSVNKLINKKIDYRFLDMLTGYYWQISFKENTVSIKTCDVVLSPYDSKELFKMLEIEITKSAIYETQKQNVLIK